MNHMNVGTEIAMCEISENNPYNGRVAAYFTGILISSLPVSQDKATCLLTV